MKRSKKNVPPKTGLAYKEFSHVNGPKDQAGGCLADLLFYGVNIQIYALRNIYGNFFFQDVYSDQFFSKNKDFLIGLEILFDAIVDFPDQ